MYFKASWEIEEKEIEDKSLKIWSMETGSIETVVEEKEKFISTEEDYFDEVDGCRVMYSTHEEICMGFR